MTSATAIVVLAAAAAAAATVAAAAPQRRPSSLSTNRKKRIPPRAKAPNAGAENGQRVIVVQPTRLRRSQQQGNASQQQQGLLPQEEVQLHAWPHPNALQDVEQQRPAPLERGGADWAGERAYFGQSVEYYRNGQPLQATDAAEGVPHVDEQLQRNSPIKASEQSQIMRDSYNNDDNPSTNFDEWMATGYGQRAQGSAAPVFGDNPVEAHPHLSTGAPEDLDVVAGKQVILRPRLNNNDAVATPADLRPIGASLASVEGSGGQGNAEPVVYYYNPLALHAPSQGRGEMDAPELTLPEVVYTAAGHALPLDRVHAGGRNEVFLEVRPQAVWGRSSGGSLSERLATLQSKLQFDARSGSGSSNGGARSHDQLIVVGTVATMAVLVGALVAQRLRSKHLLESCLHPELDDDEWEDDDPRGGSLSAAKKFDGDSQSFVGSEVSSRAEESETTGLNGGGGLSALLGSRTKVGHYGTAHDGSGLHWRGDLEKFDV